MWIKQRKGLKKKTWFFFLQYHRDYWNALFNREKTNYRMNQCLKSVPFRKRKTNAYFKLHWWCALSSHQIDLHSIKYLIKMQPLNCFSGGQGIRQDRRAELRLKELQHHSFTSGLNPKQLSGCESLRYSVHAGHSKHLPLCDNFSSGPSLRGQQT